MSSSLCVLHSTWIPARHPHHTGPRLLPTSLALLTLLSLAPPLYAIGRKTIPGQQEIAQLELRASQANPREQCFLYTELVDTMTVQAGQELNAGQTEQAAATLKKVNHYAHLIHLNLTKNTKRLKQAQMLMHHTTYLLAQYLHLVSGDDQVQVQTTLKQLDKVNDELLTQVFNH